MTKREKLMLKNAKEHFVQNPTVRSVSLGYRYRGGKKTGEKCIVVGVGKKMAANKIDRFVKAQILSKMVTIGKKRLMKNEK